MADEERLVAPSDDAEAPAKQPLRRRRAALIAGLAATGTLVALGVAGAVSTRSDLGAGKSWDPSGPEAHAILQAWDFAKANASDPDWEHVENADFQKPTAARVGWWQIDNAKDYEQLLNYVIMHQYAGFSIKGKVAWVFNFNNEAMPSKKEDLDILAPGQKTTFVFCKSCSKKKIAEMKWQKKVSEMGARDHTEPLCGDYGSGNEDTRTMYMYRAQSDADYNFSNVNAADIVGVLLYLHHEVVYMCPRKYDITRIIRKKVTIRNNPEWRVTAGWGDFFMGPYAAYDNTMCTAPDAVEALVNVGCQAQNYAGIMGHWYSLPGPCPMSDNKTKECMARQMGGVCSCDYTLGTGPCTYHYEDAGEISLDALTGVPGNYYGFCGGGGKEYDRGADTGFGMDFWNGYYDNGKAWERVRKLEDAFAWKYPGLPRKFNDGGCH